MTLEQREKQLQALLAKLPGELDRIAKVATMRAVEEATEMTPPTQDDLRGTDTRSGEMKQHWATDSQTTPQRRGDDRVTELNNDKAYASYVNDGHRMDRHFVPGLYINPGSGLLEYDPSKKVGLVVGTKAKYVPGLHITDKARKKYRETIEAESKRLEDMLK